MMLREEAIQMSNLTVRLYSLCRERENQFVSQYGLTNSEFHCLYLLLQQDNQAVNQLASAMSNSPSRLTRIIDPLIKKQFVKRVELENDRRLRIISLTPAGKLCVARIVEVYHTMHEDILNELIEASPEQVIHSIDALITAMEVWKSKKEMINKSANTLSVEVQS